MSQRIDLATPIHKCVRKLLFEQAMLLARTDHRDEASCRDACAALDRGFVMLREHADHEDEVIFPVLSALDSGLASEAARQHSSLEQHMREIERNAVGLRLATSAERVELGKQLLQRFNVFVAAQLSHLAFEETELNRVLWQAKSDEELAQLRQSIRERTSPARGKVWLELMLESLDPAELGSLAPPSPTPQPLVA
jgi:hemerythrin-like domain-containing protein